MQKEFQHGKYEEEINVRDFIQTNYTPYTGDAAFLAKPTARTNQMMEKVNALLKAESEKGGVLDVDTERVSSLLSYPAGYIDRENELIVGLQTDEPLKRGVNPFGGIRMARQACEAYGYKLSDLIETEFKYKTTHNDGVFHVYTDEMRAARHAGLITGLPDAYGRGRIIGDYRRVALYGVDKLIEEKEKDRKLYGKKLMDENNYPRFGGTLQTNRISRSVEKNGKSVRLRYFPSRAKCERGDPMDVFRLSRRHPRSRTARR